MEYDQREDRPNDEDDDPIRHGHIEIGDPPVGDAHRRKQYLTVKTAEARRPPNNGARLNDPAAGRWLGARHLSREPRLPLTWRQWLSELPQALTSDNSPVSGQSGWAW